MMLGCCGGGFGAFGCIVSGGAAAAAAFPSADCIAGSLAGSFGDISFAMLLSDWLRRCGGGASGARWGRVSAAAAPPARPAAPRARLVSHCYFDAALPP